MESCILQLVCHQENGNYRNFDSKYKKKHVLPCLNKLSKIRLGVHAIGTIKFEQIKMILEAG
jgi:hypothetical protein